MVQLKSKQSLALPQTSDLTTSQYSLSSLRIDDPNNLSFFFKITWILVPVSMSLRSKTPISWLCPEISWCLLSRVSLDSIYLIFLAGEEEETVEFIIFVFLLIVKPEDQIPGDTRKKQEAWFTLVLMIPAGRMTETSISSYNMKDRYHKAHTKKPNS